MASDNIEPVNHVALALGQIGQQFKAISTTDPLPVTLVAGGLIIGTVDIDQTTPGVTNGVVVNSGTVTTVSAVTAITNALPTGTNTLGAVKDAGPNWTAAFG